MNSMKVLLLLVLTNVIIFSCKKDPIICYPYTPNVAPCTIPEEIFEIDSIIYGPSSEFPHATLRITFLNTTMEMAFNKVPETGMYHLTSHLVGSYSLDNQMATVVDSGSFKSFSDLMDDPEMYIENYNNELIISYCDLTNGGNYNFDPSINAYVGIPSGNRKIRMSY